jgi:hypothetical protein
MPVEYQIDHDQRLVQAKAYGAVTVQDFIAYQREVWSRKDVVGYDELIDTSQAQEALDFTGAHLQEVATLASSMDLEKRTAKLAIVASNDFYYGLGRMYESYRGLQEGNVKQVAVFRSLKEALEWIHENQLKDDK